MVASAPPRRIRDCACARTLFNDLVKRDFLRGAKRAQARNQIEGGAPMNQAKLDEQGRGWMMNHNFGVARADFNRAKNPYFRMVHDVPNVAAVAVQGDYPDAEKWQRIFEQNFNLFLAEWGVDYLFHFLAMSHDHVGFGVGTAGFEDAETPRWRHVARNDIFLPEETPANVEQFDAVFVRHTMLASELYQKTVADEAAKDAGWHLGAVKTLLKKLWEKNGEQTAAASTVGDDWERVQNGIRDNDLGFALMVGRVKLVSMLVREWDGKITRYIFPEDFATDKDEFIFEQRDAAEKLSHMLHCLFFDIPLSNRSFHGIRGFAIENYTHAATINRLWCRIMDATTMSLALNFKDTNGAGVDEFPILNFGPVNITPPNMEQFAVYPQLQAALLVNESLGQAKAENNALYRQASQQIAKSQTATQANILASNEAEVSQGQASYYLAQYGLLITEQFRRLRLRGNKSEDAVKFRNRCIKSGIPKDIFHTVEITVTTAAEAGTASPMQREQKLNEATNFLGAPEVDRRVIIETWFSQKFGPNFARRAVPAPPEEGTANAATSYALVENNVMAEGTPLPVVPQQDHVAHLSAHLPVAGAVIAAFQEGTSPPTPENAVLLQNFLPHIEVHVALLGKDESRKLEFKAATDQYNAMSNAARKYFATLMPGAA